MNDKPWWFDEERLALAKYEDDKMSKQSKPREFFLIHRPGWTEGWIYNHLDAAEKRLSSGLKRPDFADECRIIRVIDGKDFDALSARCAELEEQNKYLASSSSERDLMEIESLRGQLSKKEADHKLIMDSVERQRDLNDRQTAELKTLREDWVKLSTNAQNLSTDVQAYIDSTTRFQNGDEQMSEKYWMALTLIPSRVRQLIADLKYKGE